MASKPDLPVIVTTDLSSQANVSRTNARSPTPPVSGHSRKSSDYLSPNPIIKSSSHKQESAPSSPEGSINIPPSPTLSTHSVHFQTSLALRDNPVHAESGMSSLGMLGPSDSTTKHAHKPSASSFDGSIAGTEPEVPLSARSDTTTVAGSAMTSAKSKASKKEKEPEEPEHLAHIDPTTETMDPSPFEFRPLKLASLVDPKNFDLLREMNGADGIVRGLGSHRTRGLSGFALGAGSDKDGDEPPYSGTLQDRQRIYGTNVIPTRKSKSLLMLMWLALQDKVLILLSSAAVVSLALGFYEAFRQGREQVVCVDDETKLCDPPRIDYVEGVAIVIAILIVVMVGSLNDWQKEKQFQKLNEKKEDRNVKVIRNGKEQLINIKDVLVGDIALMEPGEIIPCDGVFLRGHNVRCDESGATGESDAIKKFTFEDALAEYNSKGKTQRDCFIISGAKVLEGVGEYIVIAVGERSFNGRIMMALRGDPENTPLQMKLNDLAELIAKVGGLCGIILFSALMIKFFVSLKTHPGRESGELASQFVKILIISITLVVVAVPEGLPLAVTLALAFATKRMTKEQLLVRSLGSCETMANATVVCTDKTGTLTQNAMTVVAGSVGVHGKFAADIQHNEKRTNINEEKTGVTKTRKYPDDFSIDQADLNNILNPALRDLFNQAIAVNSTAFEDKDSETGKLEFVGSKTETALLRFAKELGWADYKQARNEAQVVQMIPFSSERKAMGVVVRLPGGTYRLYLKGASEILTKLCKRHIVVQSPSGAGPSSGDVISAKPFNEHTTDNISRTIIFYANQSLRTIALCYRDFDSWPPAGLTLSDAEIPYTELAQDLTLIGVVGIEDPLRPGVRDAVGDCGRAGVVIKMCTGDNVLTARSIATQCGIYTAGGVIMEGPVFRRLSELQRTEVVPRLQVLARSSPEDKKILVETLKALGDVVGVTGDGTNDGPALKTANVGFSMGIAGTEVAKEASDIILMDDNFASIVSAIMWGRCVNDAVRKFLQFQISVNITAVVITIISALASAEGTSVLTAVQLLWINIIMDTFAALALATDPASRALLKRQPDRKTAPLFSIDMSKQIVGQAIYQIIVILIFHFAGAIIFGFHDALDGGASIKQLLTLHTFVFNTFVYAQIFNSVNCRRLDNKLNIFEGLTKNWYFIVITAFEIGVQVLIIFFGSNAFHVVPIDGLYWGVSILLGFGSIPIGALLRCIPNAPLERFAIKFHLMADPNALPTKSPTAEKEGWNAAIDLVRDNLNTFAKVRGGRMRSSSFVLKSRSARLHDAGVALPSLLTMVPTLVASSVGAGWTPQPGSLHDPAHSDPSKSSAALWEGKLQLHPDTDVNDPAYKLWGSQVTPLGGAPREDV